MYSYLLHNAFFSQHLPDYLWQGQRKIYFKEIYTKSCSGLTELKPYNSRIVVL